MVNFLLGFIIAWFICHIYTHQMIAAECERLGGFFVNSKTYKCTAITNANNDTSTPQAIINAERRSTDEIQ